MDDFDCQEEDPTQDEPSFQFGLKSLLIATTVVAVFLGVLRAMNLPLLLYVVLAIYAVTLLLYFLLRGVHQWRRGMRLRRQVHDRRRDLAEWVESERCNPQGGGQAGTIPGPTNQGSTDL